MKKFFTFIVAAIIALSFSAVSFAQEEKPAAAPEKPAATEKAPMKKKAKKMKKAKKAKKEKKEEAAPAAGGEAAPAK